MAESDNFKIKEGKAIHRPISHRAHGAEQAPGEQHGTHWGSPKGAEKSSAKPCRDGGLHRRLRPARCSSDPKHPPDHCSFPSLTPDWNSMTAERRKRTTCSDSNVRIDCFRKTGWIPRFPAQGKSYTHGESGELGAHS